ncbi:MAG: amidohydrolase family protein [Planctomycetia bacterium]
MSEGRPRPAPITLRARHVLPIASGPIEGGWVRIERGLIRAIGRGRPTGPVHDLGDAIIMPGLVNAHTHLEFSDIDHPLAGGGGLPGWIERVVALRRTRAAGGADEAGRLADAVATGLAESAAAGVTAIGEIATAPHPVARSTGPVVRVFHETLGLSAAVMAGALSGLRHDLGRMAGGGVAGGISPHAPYSVGRPLGGQVIREAARRRLPVAMHLAESPDEAELLATGGGAFRPLLERLGAWRPDAPPQLLPVADWISLLARAPRGIVVHGTFLPDDPPALARLARHRDRLGVVVCPRTTRSLGGRLPPVQAFRDAGIRVAIGTDSRASNPDLAVLPECRALVEAGVVRPAEAVAMATLHGAWALAFERRWGILAPGRPADLAILRPAGPQADPYEAALDPATEVAATLRRGRVIAGAGPWPGDRA